MKCTKFINGKATQDNVDDIIEQYLKDNPKWRGADKEELQMIAEDAIKLHNKAIALFEELGGTVRYTEPGNGDVGPVGIDSIDIQLNGKMTIELVDGNSIQYREDGKKEFNALTPIHSTGLEDAYARVDRKNTDKLYNSEAANEATIDELLEGNDTEIADVKKTNELLIELDRKNPNSYYDEEHSSKLSEVVNKMYELSSEIGKVKVTVTKDIVEGLNEPLGEYSEKNGVRLVTAKARSRFLMSNQETLVHESIHAVMQSAFNKELGLDSDAIKADIRKLFAQAKKKLTYKDLLPDEYTEAEETKAKEIYTYVFDGKLGDYSMQDANVRLQEFIAYGMTNKYFSKALQKLELDKNEVKLAPNATTLDKIVVYVINKMAQMFKLLRHRNRRAKDVEGELVRLVYRLTDIQERHRSLALGNTHMPIGRGLEKKLNKGLEKIDTAVEKASKDMFRALGLEESKNVRKDLLKLQELSDAINKTDSTMKKILILARALPLMKSMYKASNNNYKNPEIYVPYSQVIYKMEEAGLSFITDIVADFTAGRKSLQQITDLAMVFNSRLDRMREMYYTSTLRTLIDGFTKVEIDKESSKLYNVALNKVVLRSDIQSYTTDPEELRKLITDNGYRKSKIKELISELGKEVKDNERVANMVDDATKLGKFMITGKGLRTNAAMIARGFGHKNSYDLYEYVNWFDSKKAEELVDGIASLEALGLVDGKYTTKIVELVEKDKEGVKTFLEQAHGMQFAHANEWRLSGKFQEYVKGQLHENYDRNRDIVFAPMRDKQKLTELGYEYTRPMVTEDSSNERWGVFVAYDTRLKGRVNGSLGLQRLNVKGLLLSDKIKLENKGASSKEVYKKLYKEIKRLEGVTTEYMYPVYGTSGEIVDYRYEYNRDEKEKVLEIESRGMELLAATFSQKGTQVVTDVHNRELIDVVFEDYLKTQKSIKMSNVKDSELLYYKIHPSKDNAYITSVEKNTGKILVDGKEEKRQLEEELWALLPPDTKKYIVEKNKELQIKLGNKVDENEDYSYMYIRRDLVKQLFGYNDKFMTDSALLKNLRNNHKAKLDRLEKVWRGSMAILKSNVVIKLPATIMGNILSNLKLLWFSDIPTGDALEYLTKSKILLDKYKKLEAEKRRLELMEGTVDDKEKGTIKKRLAEIVAEMEDNPLKKLIDKGMYQTIVEDIDMVETNNAIVDAVESKLHKYVGESRMVEEIVNTVFLTRKSAIGKYMLGLMQESDFHFRAATYWHLKKEGKSDSYALREATDNFINYSKIINSGFVNWLDKVGPEAFWKYFANIQRVNLKLLKKKASKVATDTVAKEVFGLPSDTLDSSLVHSWSRRLNPFNWIDNVESLIDGGTEVPIVNMVEGW